MVHAEGEGEAIVCPQLTAVQLRTARLRGDVLEQCGAQLYAQALASETSSASTVNGEHGGPHAARLAVVETLSPNDGPVSAQLLPLGFGASEDTEIDISGQLQADDPLDYYAVDLNAGDILGFNLVGAALTLSVLDSNNAEVVTTSIDEIMGLVPANSPLPFGGNAADAFVAGTSGTYFVQVSNFDATITGGAYTAELRVHRPVLENNPVGTHQVLFLDFNGAVIDSSIFGGTGIASLSPLSSFLPDFNLSSVEESSLIDEIIATVEDDFNQIRLTGENGDFNASGVAGEFDIEILNSRDHPDPFGQPNVSRMIIGGTGGELGLGAGLLGIAQSVDVGNFDTTETAVTLLDEISGRNGLSPFAANSVVVAPGASRIEMIGKVVGATVTHEAGHYFGLFHTDASNTLFSLMDSGASGAAVDAGAGLDAIFGNLDDVNPGLFNDDYEPQEGHTGFEDIVNTISWGLGTGTITSTISGTKYHDLNGDGVRGSDEPGVPGFQIFADLNANGLVDVREPNDITGADGSYSLNVQPGQHIIREILLPGWTQTAPPNGFHQVRLNFLGDEIAGIDFGNRSDSAGISGTKFNDLDGDGVFDPDEPGVPGIFIYLDLDDDNRLDLGEPTAETNADGNYSIFVPTSGTVVVREHLPPGWTITLPRNTENEYTLTVQSGVPHPGINFGNHANTDFGDAPEEVLEDGTVRYPTTSANGGAEHAVLPGFHLGTTVDGEGDGVPTVGALGDDANTTDDDEDGVAFTSPVFPGSMSTVDVTIANGGFSPGFLNAWADFNLDGDWDDPGEQIIKEERRLDGTWPFEFMVPADAVSGQTYFRFRYGYGRGMGPTGKNMAGEVEDYFQRVLSQQPEANDDQFTVNQGDVAVSLDALVNDIPSLAGPLMIAAVGDTSSGGTVIVVGGTTLTYTPPNGFFGNDSFSYSVQDAEGATDSADVSITILPSQVMPIAVDDSFTVNPGTTNNSLDVLSNDLTGQSPPITIISVTPPLGGTATVDTRGNTDPSDDVIRYSPDQNFGATDQFSYTVEDTNGDRSTATITVHVNDAAGDRVRIRLQASDSQTVNQSIQAIGTGETFYLQVWTADDLRPDDQDGDGIDNRLGVAAAFLDILYDFNLVTRTEEAVIFGADFQNATSLNSTVPGLFDEAGAFQTTNSPLGRTCQQIPNSGCDPTTNEFLVMSIPLRATATGEAGFIGDPADRRTELVTNNNGLIPDHDVLLFNPPEPVPLEDIRYENTSLTIIGAGGLPQAVDNTFHVPVNRGENNRSVLDVLANDIEATNPPLQIIDINGSTSTTVTTPQGSSATITNSGTTIDYTPRIGFEGTEQFTYRVRNVVGLEAQATVTLQVGSSPSDINVRIEIRDANGQLTTSVPTGSEFQVLGYVDDLRGGAGVDDTRLGVFAVYFDLLYNSGLAVPVNDPANRFGFDIEFASPFNVNGLSAEDVNLNVIDEVGAFQTGNGPLGGNEFLVFTLTMEAKGIGTAEFVADPADSTPFHDTLLFEPPTAVPIDRINLGVASVTITGPAGEGETPFQNRNNHVDANGDGEESPADALVIINYLNHNGSQNLKHLTALGAEGEHGSMPEHFIDVNGDNHASPADALAVINKLNSQLANAEGEAGKPVKPVLLTSDPVAGLTTGLAVSSHSIQVGPPRQASASEPSFDTASAEFEPQFDSRVYTSRTSHDAAFAAEHDASEKTDVEEELLDLLVGDEG
ncbi:MAG: hypothetical protein CMJ64_19400 [Planctomycetaceae bacterium]|nr:hypothetical protein [Planctomycetaceae bacterium]